jgi:hypothetical protein
MMRSRYLMAVLFTSLGLSLSPAMAQSGPGTGAPAPAAYSDTELKSFAGAVLEVQRLNDVYVSRFESARSFDEQEQVRQEATVAVAMAAEKNGMSMSRFQEILNHTQMDEGLADRVRQHMRESGR